MTLYFFVLDNFASGRYFECVSIFFSKICNKTSVVNNRRPTRLAKFREFTVTLVAV